MSSSNLGQQMIVMTATLGHGHKMDCARPGYWRVMKMQSTRCDVRDVSRFLSGLPYLLYLLTFFFPLYSHVSCASPSKRRIRLDMVSNNVF